MALERRTSTVSGSPWAARMSAIRPTMALNQIMSPALARAINVFSPYSVLRPVDTYRSAAFIAYSWSAPFGSACVDGGVQQVLEPAPRQRR